MADFLFILHTDDNEKACRCFQFAKIAHSKGHQVNIFLVDDGVYWSLSGRDASQKSKTGDTPADYLPYLVDKAVVTGVCTPCAKGRGLEEADFYPNMKLDTGPNLRNVHEITSPSSLSFIPSPVLKKTLQTSSMQSFFKHRRQKNYGGICPTYFAPVPY